MSRSPQTQKTGIANVWVLIILPVLIGFLGLAIEAGHLVWVGQQLQICADASALAGAQKVREDVTLARAAAANIGFANVAGGQNLLLSLNEANAPEGDIVVGRYNRDTRIFDPDATSINAVKVVARRTAGSLNGSLPLVFGPVFGRNTADLEREAIAMIGGGTGAGLIVLNEHDRYALEIFGDVHLIVNGGAIQVNSDDDEAAYIGGAIDCDAECINVVGDVRTVGQPGVPDINTGVEAMEDPLAGLPAPAYNPAADLGGISMTGDTLVASPGYYSGGIYTNGGVLTLLPGIYILDGAGLDVGGNAVFIAEGVMFYIIGTGAVNLHGTGDVTITPPDPEVYSYPGADTYEGVAIFQARDNTNEGTIIGTSVMTLEGSYYFPSNHMNLGGDAQKFGNQLIVNTMEVFGNGELTINYDGRFPAPGSRVFLVA